MTVQTDDGSEFDGILHTSNNEKFEVVLSMARERVAADAPVPELRTRMVIRRDKVVQITARDADLFADELREMARKNKGVAISREERGKVWVRVGVCVRAEVRVRACMHACAYQSWHTHTQATGARRYLRNPHRRTPVTNHARALMRFVVPILRCWVIVRSLLTCPHCMILLGLHTVGHVTGDSL